MSENLLSGGFVRSARLHAASLCQCPTFMATKHVVIARHAITFTKVVDTWRMSVYTYDLYFSHLMLASLRLIYRL